jgi:nucleoside-diphosphate-sugar epimerase
MNVMVLGATGFIGPPLVRRLLSQGHAVVAVSRIPGPGEAGATPLALDRSDARAVARAVEAHGTEAVIDLWAMTLAGTAPLLDALAGRVGRYVLASSGDIYRQYGAIQRLEPEPEPRAALAEDAPLRTRLYPYRAEPRRKADDPAAWMDDYDKIPVERAATERAGLPAVIVRLPMIYGPGDRHGRFAWAVGPMRAKAPAIELDRDWAAWRTSYGFVDDVAAGLALAATHPAAGGVYNLGPESAPDHLAWADRFAAALDWLGEVRTVARTAVAEPLRSQLSALDLTLPLATDTSRIRAELGYREVTDPQAALQRTIEDEHRRAAA